MGIYYKFASAKDFNIIPIDGSVISVAALKQRIFQSNYKSKKNSDSNGLCLGTDLDFVIVNAQTNEQYDDDSMLIANYSSLLLRRVPGTRRRKPIDTSSIVFLEPQLPMSSLSRKTSGTNSGSGFSSTSTVTTQSSQEESGFHSNDKTIPGLDEDSKIKILVNTPALDCQFSNYRRKGVEILEKKTPHEGYVCHRCNVPGHFIQHCPTNSDPNYDFKSKKTVFAAALLQQNEAAFDKQFDCRPSKRLSQSLSDVPPELLCLLCKQVMKDAALTSKCCFSSFCDKCIRDHLINSKLKCVCGAEQVLTDSLIPNITLRDAINRILQVGILTVSNSSSGENSTPKVSSVLSATEMSEKEQKPSLDCVLDDVGNKRKRVDAPNSIGSMRMEEVTSQGSIQAAAEEHHKAVAVKEEVQQKVVSGEKGKKKKQRKSFQDVEIGSNVMPVASYGYNAYPYWIRYNMQAGMEGYYYGGGMSYGSFGANF